MITSVYGCGHECGASCYSNTVSYGEHDGIAVGNYDDCHVLCGIVAVRHLDIVGKRRTGEKASNLGYIYDIEGRTEALGAAFGVGDLLLVPLAVVHGQQM